MNDACITDFRVRAFTIPTETPESDGTLRWNSTTMVLVELRAGDVCGLGYTYGNAGLKSFCVDLIKHAVMGQDPMDTSRCWGKLVHAVRNEGRVGASCMAISATDNALWDLKCKLLNQPLCHLLGLCRDRIEAYGSGGFTSYSQNHLVGQMQGWVEEGFRKVKMKVGRDAVADRERVRAVRERIGKSPEIFVDANEAYDRPTTLAQARYFAEQGVTWFEQPIYSDDLSGMKDLKVRLPDGMYLATGEYIYDLSQVVQLLQNDATDFVQLDVTRCQGVSGFLKCAGVCEAFDFPVSSHCAPALHAHLGCSLLPMRHLEYFFDHVRIENMLFDGVPRPKNGFLQPDLSRPGFGLALKEADAERFEV